MNNATPATLQMLSLPTAELRALIRAAESEAFQCRSGSQAERMAQELIDTLCAELGRRGEN